MERDNATTNIILILLLVVAVGFIVWFMTMRGGGTPAPANDGGTLELNVGTNGGGEAPTGNQ